MKYLFSDGVYKIFSVQFPGQDVDLIGGTPTAVIAGYHSVNVVNNRWNLVNVGSNGNSFTLSSASVTADGAYAGVPNGNITVGVELHGSPTPLVWNAIGTCTAGQYWVFASTEAGSSQSTISGLTWYLANGEDGTPITLEPFGGVGYGLQSRQAPASSGFSFNRVG